MKSGIYKLEWGIGYFYYGQAQNLNQRRRCHLSRLKKGTHGNIMAQRVSDKYGIPEFIVIGYFPINELNKNEQKYLDIYFGNKMCCNFSPSSENRRGIKASEYTRQLISKSKKGKPSGRKGMKLSKEWRSNISKAHLGLKQSAETVIKRIAKTKGKKRTPQQIENFKKGRILKNGKFHSDESRRKIGKSQEGRVIPESQKRYIPIVNYPLPKGEGASERRASVPDAKILIAAL